MMNLTHVRPPMVWLAALVLVGVTLGPRSTAFAQSLSLDGRVEALVELNYYVSEPEADVIFEITPGTLPPNLKARAVVDLTGAPDPAVENPLTAAGTTSLKLPLAAVPTGSHPVTLSIIESGSVVWQTTDTLVKRPAPPTNARITQIDRYRRTLRVDGQPFFPIGVFGVFPDQLQAVADAGFNVTFRWKGATNYHRWDRSKPWNDPYNRTTVVRTYLDQVHAAGLYALEAPVKLATQDLYVRYNDVPGRYSSGLYWADKYPIHNSEVTPGVVANAKDHPAVIGYYSYDEPDNFYPTQPDHKYHLLMQEGVEAWYDVVHELDPYHAVMTLFAVGLSKVQDWNAWDMAARDYYVSRGVHMSEVYKAARGSVDVAWGKRTPYIFTPLFEESSGRPVPLSPEEQRAQTYLSLIADVKGLIYWDWAAAYGPNWDMLRQMAQEIRHLSPILLERSPAQSVAYRYAGTENSVKALVKNHGGRTYLIVANAETAPVRVTFGLPSRYTGAATVLFESREVYANAGSFMEMIEPYGRRVFELPPGITWGHGESLDLWITKEADVIPPDPVILTDPINLAANGGFEYDYGRLPGWPVAWGAADSLMESGVAGVPAGRWTPDPDAYFGQRSMRLVKTAPGIGNSNDIWHFARTPAIQQTIAYPAAGAYTFSAWMKGSTNARVWLLIGDSDVRQITVTTGWQRYEQTINRTSGGSGSIRLYLMQQGTLWVDAFRVDNGTPPAPAISAFQVNDGGAQRSMVRSVTLTFDQPVRLQAGAVTLTRRGSPATTIAVAVANPSGDGRTFVVTPGGSGIIGGSVPDGVYDLTVHASQVMNERATPMAANGSITFFRLFGDSDGNRTVNNIDNFRFGKAYNSFSTDANYLWYFDYDANGTINNGDNFQFGRRYNTSVTY